MSKEPKLILLADVLETKLRKERELEFYKKELEKIQRKMLFLQKDLDLTRLIMSIIEKEQVYDVKEAMETRMITDGDETNG